MIVIRRSQLVLHNDCPTDINGASKNIHIVFLNALLYLSNLQI